jgi:hypothetical protein
MNQDLKDGFKLFVETWPKYKQMMLDIGLNIIEEQAEPNLEETIFYNEKK